MLMWFWSKSDKDEGWLSVGRKVVPHDSKSDLPLHTIYYWINSSLQSLSEAYLSFSITPWIVIKGVETLHWIPGIRTWQSKSQMHQNKSRRRIPSTSNVKWRIESCFWKTFHNRRAWIFQQNKNRNSEQIVVKFNKSFN